jgi:hypothetical protein
MDAVACGVCGEAVEIDGDSCGIVIEFYNLVPEYSEYYGFCETHRPNDDEFAEVKDRIRCGARPVIPD